jgi:hypothetical protein
VLRDRDRDESCPVTAIRADSAASVPLRTQVGNAIWAKLIAMTVDDLYSRAKTFD